MRRGSVYRRCSRCSTRAGDRSRTCSKCGSTSFIWTAVASAGVALGRRRRKVASAPTKAAAEKELTRILGEIDRGIDADPGRLTVASYFSRWLAHHQGRIRATTYTRYESLARLWIVPVIGAVALGKVRPAHVQAALDRMRDVGKAPRSVIQCRAVMTAAFGQARRWQLLSQNPADGAQAPKASAPDLHIPTAAETTKILGVANEHPQPYPTIVGTIASGGLRKGEGLGLRWPDVDLDRGIVRVTASLQRAKVDGHWVTASFDPKTDRGRREIVLPRFAVESLRAWRKVQNEWRLAAGEGWADTQHVFTNALGRPVQPNTFAQVWERIRDGAGFPDVRLHDLRHGCATMLLASGVHPKVVSERLGHSKVGFTLDVYAHVLPSMQAEAAAAIEDALGGEG